MTYLSHAVSPLGDILLAADEAGLTGLWFRGQKYYAAGLDGDAGEEQAPALTAAKNWLEIYFSGREPDFLPPLHLRGTAFQKMVWECLLDIPYGSVTTYGAIAARIAARQGRDHMSPQAVGGAVGRNPISVIVPCHRVVGANGSLTGYAGGVDKKLRLLTLEGAPVETLRLSGGKGALR